MLSMSVSQFLKLAKMTKTNTLHMKRQTKIKMNNPVEFLITSSYRAMFL